MKYSSHKVIEQIIDIINLPISVMPNSAKLSGIKKVIVNSTKGLSIRDGIPREIKEKLWLEYSDVRPSVED